MRRWVIVVLVVAVSMPLSRCWAQSPVTLEQRFSANDSLAIGDEADARAREFLERLAWTPASFDVTFEEPDRRKGDVLVRFPSAVVSGDETNDLVAMEWYVARDLEGRPLDHAPAVVVVHESGRGMEVGRVIAKGLALEGLHGFMIQMPGYGKRRGSEPRDDSAWLHAMRQAIADVRRARDAVAVLPTVDSELIALQGTSLGGFISATVAGLDHGYDRVFVLLAGGNIQQVIEQGDRDAAGLRKRLEAVGITGDGLRELTEQVEPLTVAHRVDAAHTWLYTGRHDTVVPPACSRAWSEAVGLESDHYRVLEADHYTGIIFLPQVLGEMFELTTGRELLVPGEE